METGPLTVVEGTTSVWLPVGELERSSCKVPPVRMSAPASASLEVLLAV